MARRRRGGKEKKEEKKEAENLPEFTKKSTPPTGPRLCKPLVYLSSTSTINEGHPDGRTQSLE